MIARRRPRHPIETALVTGGLGFIGAALCRRLLSEGVRVIVVDNHLFGRRRRALPDHRALTVYRCDVRDRKTLMGIFRRHKPDAVFHLAAIAFIPACVKDPATAAAVHLDGTLNIVAASRATRVRHLHFASSAAVYSPHSVVLSEDRTPAHPPPDIYSLTKLAGELICEQLHRHAGTHVVITRAFNVYGPHRTNRFLVPSVCEQIRAGSSTLELGNLSTARDYIHVDDAVEAIVALVRGTKGLVVANVGSGRKTTGRELVRLCERIAGRRVPVVSSRRYSRAKLIDRPAWQADIRRIRRLVGWRPRRRLEDGLRELLLG
jgi:nucleoside-diphosphate-sugar epimerase